MILKCIISKWQNFRAQCFKIFLAIIQKLVCCLAYLEKFNTKGLLWFNVYIFTWQCLERFVLFSYKIYVYHYLRSWGCRYAGKRNGRLLWSWFSYRWKKEKGWKDGIPRKIHKIQLLWKYLGPAKHITPDILDQWKNTSDAIKKQRQDTYKSKTRKRRNESSCYRSEKAQTQGRSKIQTFANRKCSWCTFICKCSQSYW